ncbi:MAG TPA: inositol monophosphatase family protein [Thermomicrobiales bacterium]|jgi:myo-inositol-1(or 4)-monophosphatase|nr:inositol monophosphatase family protein [Thermomicrobiales bacterium]
MSDGVSGMAGDSALPAGAREVAIRAALDAGAILRGRLNEDRQVAYKGVIDLVTDADRASEELISGRIRTAFPDHGFLGEEGTRGAEGADYSWVVDPLDGTTNYAHAYPHFAVSIALEHAGQAVLGVVYDPMRDELFVAERGRGAEMNGAPIQVTTGDELLRSLLATGFPYDPSSRHEALAIWNRLMDACQGVRRDGAAALNLCWTAAGRLDGFYERHLKPWDMAAGGLIVAEAGGVVTNYAGDPFDLYGIEVIAAGPALHVSLRQAIAEAVGTIA